ncbi:hypothetical protein EV651_117119 [Kribbella sp. VKM Ac-2571]|nr:hypothetical protein EV651_117119 [Kribbella sp. VKM Ac-2571]
MAEFRQAAEVADGFHAEVVAPLVGDVDYAAGLLGLRLSTTGCRTSTPDTRSASAGTATSRGIM